MSTYQSNKKYLLLLFVTLLLIYPERLLSQPGGEEPTDCYDISENCSDWLAYSSTTITIPGYTLCPISCTYTSRECPDPDCEGNTLTQIYIEKFSVPEDDPDCYSLLQQYYPDWPNKFTVNEYAIGETLKEIYRELSKIMFLNLYQNSPNQDELECEGIPCEVPACAKAYNVYFMPTCMWICYKYDESHDSGIYKFYECENSPAYCCKKIRRYCYCVATQTVITFEDFDQAYGNCEELEVPDGVCQGELYRIFPCMFMCQPDSR